MKSSLHAVFDSVPQLKVFEHNGDASSIMNGKKIQVSKHVHQKSFTSTLQRIQSILLHSKFFQQRQSPRCLAAADSHGQLDQRLDVESKNEAIVLAEDSESLF